MALTWVTPRNTIANLTIGSAISLPILAADTAPSHIITYQLIAGELPTGMTLSSTGTISGTPAYSSASNNYFTTLNYNFTIRATSTSGATPIDGAFNIILSNTVNSDFSWVTPAGDLGTVPNGEFYQLPLQVEETQSNTSTKFSFVSGELPPGMQVVPGYYFDIVNIQFNQTILTKNKTNVNYAVIITTKTAHTIYNGTQVNFKNVGGTVELNGNVYYAQRLSATQFTIYTDPLLTDQSLVVTVGLGAYTSGGQVWDTGYLQGVPTITNSIAVNTAEAFRFTIRAESSAGHVRDQAFNLTVTNVYGPIIRPEQALGNYYLGSYFDGTYYEQQLSVTELNPNVSIKWSNIGSLPPGITLSSDGKLSGYIQPLELVGKFGPAGYDSDIPAPGKDEVLQSAEYDYGPYDFNQLNQTSSYTFTVQAYDGANYDLQTYILNVISRSGYTADNSHILGDNSFLTIDASNKYTPVIRNGNITTLPTGRSDSNYAYKFDGYDFQGDTVTYTLFNTTGTFDAYVYDIDAGFDYGGTGTNGSPVEDSAQTDINRGGIGFDSSNLNGSTTGNLPGILLDASTGWLYGRLTPQSSSYSVYSIGVQVSKIRDGVTYASTPTYFNLPVLGDVNNTVTWITPIDLGSIDNGSISTLFVEAKSTEGKPLVYTLVDKSGVPIRLPQGLELLPTGEISGRVTFEATSIDEYATTFDGNDLTLDRVYNFTVQAATADNSASSTREFTVKLNVIDNEPYDNLYLRAMLAFDQRQTINSVLTNKEIFVPELIYRNTDPWFGVAEDLEMLFLPGLKPKDIDAYAEAIARNHYTKPFNFGNIETAVVLDSNYNVKYEVVYINVIDSELNSAGNGPPLELDLTNVIANPYIDEAGAEHKIVYPNTSVNMIDDLIAGVGYFDQSSLPAWMTSNQPGTTPGTFSNPLGFTRAVVLAYTVPGASKLIAYRLKNSGINFNNIEFTVDRYFLDDYYTTNFDTSTETYLLGKETTFDATPNQNVGTIVASVNYAVSVPFSQINGRSVDYIRNNGGLDSITSFKVGDTLIFARQENFLNPGPYEGWVEYDSAWIGDNILTPEIEGYGTGSFEIYSVIPGFLEKTQSESSINKRGGVWKISIVNNLVNLVFVQEIQLNDRVRIVSGGTYAGSILYYNQNLNPGQTVPYYAVYRHQLRSVAKRTTFNGDTTRFYNYRDQYYEPGTQDKYVKFPQYGVFK